MVERTPSRWSTPAMIVAASAGFLAGGLWQPVRAEVTPGAPRETFIDGGVLANETLKQQLIVIKSIDDRLAKFQKALTEAVEK